MAELEIGGNTLLLGYGNVLKLIASYYTRRSNKLVDKGSKIVISNPTYNIVNPFTLVIGFTVGSSKKYQLITQGDYKKRYKELEGEDTLTDQELFILIESGRNDWFLKN